MRRYVRDVIGGAFALYLGKTKAFHDARARALSGDAILSVYFHDPTRRIFEGCVQWLGENGFRFLSAEELQEILSSQRRPPGPSVWLSIDDAWRGNLENVVPVVRRHRIPITLFVPVGPVEDNGVLWWSHIRRHRQHLPDEFRQDYEKFWHVPEKVRRRIVQELMEAFPFKGPREVLTIQELKEIADIPQVTLGAHSVHHCNLVECDADELEEEMLGCKQKLEEWTGKGVKGFSYPRGYHDDRVLRALASYRYEFAATTEWRAIFLNENPLLLPRFCVQDGGFVCEAHCHLLGIWDPLVRSAKTRLETWRRH